jgi:dolichol-phosphate mannosyltransferase
VRDALVVVPTYNERDNLATLIEHIRSLDYRVLVVDDASPDGTGRLADELAAADPAVAVVHRSEKAGLGPAYAAGFAQALETDASVICQIDADFSHDPDDLPRLVAAVEAGADLAIGSRYVPGGSTPDWALSRRMLSAGGNIYSRLMLGGSVHDMTAGFRAWDAAALAKLDPGSCHASGYAFQVEMAWRSARNGFTITEVPIVFRDRRVGESKMDRSIVVEAMRLVTGWGIRRVLGRLPSAP